MVRETEMIARFILAIVLALGWVPAHAITCPDGYSLASSLSACPVAVSSVSAINPTQSGATITGIGDDRAPNATQYTYVSTSPYPPGCSAANYLHADLSSPTPSVVAAAVRAKQACTRHDIIKSGAGSSLTVAPQLVFIPGQFWASITGGAQGVTYYAHFEMFGGSRRGAISMVQTVSFTTTSSPGPGSSLTGNQRFFRDDGNDLADGTSNANAWRSLSKCGASLPAGTDCNLMSGDTWTNETLTIEHSGLVDDWNVVRTYEMSAGSPVASLVGAVRAKLRGSSLTTACLTAGNCDYRLSALHAAGLSGAYDSYVYIAHTADYTRVSNIEVSFSHAFALIAQGNWPTQGSLHHLIFEDNLFENIGLSVTLFENGIQDVVFRRNTLSLYGTCAQQRQMGGGNISELCPSAIFPAGGAVARSYPARFLLEGNYFLRGAGEGFDCHSGTTYVIMRGNVLAQLQSSGLYPDGCNHVVIENNISIGPRGEDFGYYNGPGEGFGGGMTSVIEDWQGQFVQDQTNVVIRNNLTIKTGYANVWGMFAQQITWGNEVGGYNVGNTNIDAILYDIYVEPTATNANFTTLTLQANLNWNQSSGATSKCTMPNIGDVVKSHNHKYTAYTGSAAVCNGTSDTTGDPLLTVSSYATWATYDFDTLPTFADARPQATSPVLNAGPTLTTTVITHSNYGFAAEQMADVLSGAITLDNWAKILYYDALNQVRGCSGAPEIGAVERCS